MSENEGYLAEFQFDIHILCTRFQAKNHRWDPSLDLVLAGLAIHPRAAARVAGYKLVS